ncbi:MAG: LD-carboxypeptidase [Desulfobulbus propionicus]|nr:MAG: LD-carboxypeptidase [Desulfobulbus propionicus]
MERGIRVLQSMGFGVKIAGDIRSDHPYLAGSDQSRADTLLSLWYDNDVQALMAVRGGFGCMRLMPYLDVQRVRNNPKLLIGFSDLTALLQALYVQAGVVGIHGPVVTTLGDLDEQSARHFFSLICGTMNRPVTSPNLEILRPGWSRGPLIGGNLTTLVHLIGTPWECPWKGSILLLEDTGEPLYRIDRMLTQLACSGKLAQLSGLILGSFDTGQEGNELPQIRLQEQVWNRVLELTAPYTYPVWARFPLGHQQANMALPIGMEADMNSATGQLLFLAKEVRFL